MNYRTHEDILVGDLVRGVSIHNDNCIGLVVGYKPNNKTEYTVHWLIDSPATGYYSFSERKYDLEKLS